MEQGSPAGRPTDDVDALPAAEIKVSGFRILVSAEGETGRGPAVKAQGGRRLFGDDGIQNRHVAGHVKRAGTISIDQEAPDRRYRIHDLMLTRSLKKAGVPVRYPGVLTFLTSLTLFTLLTVCGGRWGKARSQNLLSFGDGDKGIRVDLGHPQFQASDLVGGDDDIHHRTGLTAEAA